MARTGEKAEKNAKEARSEGWGRYGGRTEQQREDERNAGEANQEKGFLDKTGLFLVKNSTCKDVRAGP
jgi:hypothetical protein